ncbi:unnamed protein product [Brassicogethes aeneus]|uniref:Gamma-interferon-inducible lysosomal thiol reductase n=1 Tax=Brassicogethes aeneus TaxID=1431903 RepID=A0A9P0B2Q7_BRAAE|nr:unnamed protein product [Brassicogethes aeneus]
MGLLKSLFVFNAFFVFAIYGKNIKVSLYYECLCPDSVKFVVNQLYPTYKDLGNRLDVELVAYGFAKTEESNNTYMFTCQHGPKECYGNKIHSCVASQYSIPEAIQYLYCAMSSGRGWDDVYLKKCATVGNLKWTEIQSCITSGRGDLLLAANGNKTLSVTPPINFIPTIIFNDEFNQTYQSESLIDFKKMVCELLDYEDPGCKENNEAKTTAISKCSDTSFAKQKLQLPVTMNFNLFFVILGIFVHQAVSTINVAIYYEALCPDSTQFITNQLYPNFNQLDRYLNLELVPFGKAFIDTSVEPNRVLCQHGARECLGNKYQACLLNQNKSQKVNVDVVNCIMIQMDPSNVEFIEKCGKLFGYDTEEMKKCAQGPEGDSLIKMHGNRTMELDPIISFVPTIIFNGAYNHADQAGSQYNFASVVCSKIQGQIPDVCRTAKEVGYSYF